ncbi:UDP-2,3-diacylglucosamine diphosphatase [Thalassotalea atypica]|uniref:UDP-2,3-diacylglucosamine diphosphatase n=1 Tax=Thalassotalea atypica TaxID=2054316 RepID=UPI002572FEF3|nr:UDP-2,3-diacylglucosamine diphosphatase [Thalassotalea atypica]
MTISVKEQVSYFIADLHLTESRKDITECFLSFLSNEAVKAENLYILGDLFEYWVGDDDDSGFVTLIASALKALSLTGTQLFFIQGNRDFLLGHKYAQTCGMTLLNDVEKISLYGTEYVILHGDTLCIDDVDYQAFRKKSRSWWWQGIMKSLPLWLRKKIADDYRKKSAHANAAKSQEIMDVSQAEVIRTFESYQVPFMIHGHTHRPAIHDVKINNQTVKRIVLGDWYEHGAWLKLSSSGFELLDEPFGR